MELLLFTVWVFLLPQCSLLASADAQFEPADSGASVCPASAPATRQPARSDIECAVLCAASDACKSFNHVAPGEGGGSSAAGSCSMTNCSVAAGAPAFRKKSASAASLIFGYEQLIGARRFWVFQQRKTGAENFSRTWADYELGFGLGNNTDFWSGLLSLNSLTSRGNVTLRIEMTDLDGIQYVAECSNFTVGDASTNYIMQYTSFLTASSTVSDSLFAHNGMQFSTFDRDNDRSATSCSLTYAGSSGFWFNNCLSMSPNGLYSITNKASAVYMSYSGIQYPGVAYSTLREMRMMLQLN